MRRPSGFALELAKIYLRDAAEACRKAAEMARNTNETGVVPEDMDQSAAALDAVADYLGGLVPILGANGTMAPRTEGSGGKKT